MVDNIIEMIHSSDARDRRTGLTILFNQWDEFNEEELNKIRIAYLSKLTPQPRHDGKFQHFEDTRSIRQTAEDIEFVAEHVCDDPKKLGHIFMFNVDGIIRDVKIKKLNNERQTEGNITGAIAN